VPKGNYAKGEFLDLNGFAEGKVNLILTASPGKKAVLNAVVEPDENGFFSFKHFIHCTDPAGDWRILLFDEKEEKEKMISVKPSVECEFLRIDFIDPSSFSYFRKQKFDVRVKITDAGREVNNAEAYFWDFNGNKHRLYFEGSGIYFFEGVEVPLNAELKKWDLMVVSVSGGKEKLGGSNVISFEVRAVPIKIEVLNPIVKEFDFGKPLNLKVKPLYPDGSPASKVKMWVEYNNQKVNLEEDSGIFSVLIPTEDLNAEIFYINVFAEDEFGNSGNVSLDLEPKGYLYFYIAQNAIVYVFPALFVIYVLFVSFKEARTFVNRIILKRKRKKILILMKKLQDDYFNKQIISRQVYFEQYENYKRELDYLENKLSELREEQELK
jgi:hypothetical protein